MEPTIRKATSDDIESILTIVNHSIQFSTAIYDYSPRTLEQQKDWFLDKVRANMPVLVAECNGKVVGFGTFGEFRVKIGYRFTVEHSVYVNDDFIGKGIGRRLLSQLIALATADGFHVMIGFVDAENAGSIRFHEKLGFEITGHLKEVGYKFERRLDVIILQLRLK